MPLTRQRYRVYLNPTAEDPADAAAGHVEHEVEITHGDHLRGELEAAKQGLPSVKDAPMNHTTVWIWCAMVRLGLYAGPFLPFKLQDLAGIEPVRDEDTGDPAVVDVDPTHAAAGTPSR